jgi:exosortase A
MTADAPPAEGTSARGTSPLQAWASALICVAIACALFGVAFWWEIRGAIKVWEASTAYNHCFLVLPLTAALLWNRRKLIAQLRPNPSLWALVLVPVLSAVWVLAALLDVLEAEQLIVVALLEVLLLAVLGWKVFRALLAPLLFLFFLVPFGEFLTPALQRFTAAVAVGGLQLLGIPVFADGFIIQIPEGTFEVAEACAGLRFLIASIVFGCFFATVIYRSVLRRVIFMVLSIAVPIVANGLRALGLVILAHLEGSAAAVEADHILYGWLFFSAVTLLLIVIGMSFADRPRPLGAQLPAAEPARNLRIGATMAVGLLMALAGPAYLMATDKAAAAVPLAEIPGPRAATGWVREAEAETDWRPVAPGTAAKSLESYRNGGITITRFVAAYPLPARGSPFARAAGSVTNSEAWRLKKSGRTTLRENGAEVEINSSLVVRQPHYRLIWWFYLVDDQLTASALSAKFLQARTALLGGNHTGKFVALSTDADDLEAASGSLSRFLDDSGIWGQIRVAHTGW